MNKVRWYIKSLGIVERNRRNWVAKLGVGKSVGFYPRVGAWYARRFVTQSKSMKYLGRNFTYDSPATPFNLGLYQGEVGYQILGHVDARSSIRRVLDIGGNLGQFAVTVKHVLPHAEVDTFEPNTEVLPYLRENTKDVPGIHVYPYGVGPESSPDTLYFEPNRSGFGSLLPANSGGGVWAGAVEVPIKIISDVPAVTGHDQYDLVKIDVEGFEANVVRALAGVRIRYLYIELSSRVRDKDYRHSELFDMLRRQFGEFDILSQEQFGGTDIYFNMLLEFFEPASDGGSGT